jgi:hypothetical protein
MSRPLRAMLRLRSVCFADAESLGKNSIFWIAKIANIRFQKNRAKTNILD